MHKSSYDALKAMGRCVICAKERAEPGHVTCLACRMDERKRKREEWPNRKESANLVHREYLKNRRDEAKKNGMCIMCCKRPAVPGKSCCAPCLAKSNNRQKHKRDGKRMTDHGGCPKCGKLLAPGYKLCPECLKKYQKLMLYARSQRTEKNYFESMDKVYFQEYRESHPPR